MFRARRKLTFIALVTTIIAASSCEKASVNVTQGYGPDPVLPAPRHPLIPTVHIAPATGWPEGNGAALVVGHQPALGRLCALLLSGSEADWTIKKGALWWFTNRVREDETQTVLRAVIPSELV